MARNPLLVEQLSRLPLDSALRKKVFAGAEELADGEEMAEELKEALDSIPSLVEEMRRVQDGKPKGGSASRPTRVVLVTEDDLKETERPVFASAELLKTR